MAIVKILAKAKQSAVLDATTLRVGQISGSSKTGALNTTEWIPSIIKSGVTLQSLPALEGVSFHFHCVNDTVV